MLDGLIGYFFGGTIGGTLVNTEALSASFDTIFLFIIIISFYLYYKMHVYIKDREDLAQRFKKTCEYTLLALSILNFIFIGIISEFYYLRIHYDIALPLIFDVVFLILAISAIIIVVKAYGLLVCEGPENHRRKK